MFSGGKLQVCPLFNRLSDATFCTGKFVVAEIEHF